MSGPWSPFMADARHFAEITFRLLGDQLSYVPPHSAKYRNLAVIHKGRCGSTVLGALLSQNPCVYWDGEALEPHGNPSKWLRRLQGARGAMQS